MMGTPAYMPPEQARGESALIGPQADDVATQSALARRILGDHLACLAAIAIALGLQVAA